MRPSTIGIESLPVAELQDIIRELALDREELREQLTAQTNAIRSLRAVVLSMASREGSPRADLLAIADALSRVMANDYPQPRDLPPIIPPAHPGLHLSPAPSFVEAAHSSLTADGATFTTAPRKGKE